jgi:hypothetical protein
MSNPTHSHAPLFCGHNVSRRGLRCNMLGGLAIAKSWGSNPRFRTNLEFLRNQ